jgi:hypothetical protein
VEHEVGPATRHDDDAAVGPDDRIDRFLIEVHEPVLAERPVDHVAPDEHERDRRQRREPPPHAHHGTRGAGVPAGQGEH